MPNRCSGLPAPWQACARPRSQGAGTSALGLGPNIGRLIEGEQVGFSWNAQSPALCVLCQGGGGTVGVGRHPHKRVTRESGEGAAAAQQGPRTRARGIARDTPACLVQHGRRFCQNNGRKPWCGTRLQARRASAVTTIRGPSTSPCRRCPRWPGRRLRRRRPSQRSRAASRTRRRSEWRPAGRAEGARERSCMCVLESACLSMRADERGPTCSGLRVHAGVRLPVCACLCASCPVCARVSAWMRARASVCAHMARAHLSGAAGRKPTHGCSPGAHLA